jgi:hypothetical protein
MVDELPKVDRRGTSVLVPLGMGAVFLVLVVLMLARNIGGSPPQPASDPLKSDSTQQQS